VVAEDEEGIAGFISGYPVPDRDTTLFIWQVAVDPRMRRMGLAGKMIQNILERNTFFRYIETTVTPSNSASDRLFRSVGEKLNTELTVLEYYKASLFGGSDHEPENLYRIGPFTV
jgi:diaminobutyrate acetyltransferase